MNSSYSLFQDLVKHLREQDIQTFVVTVTNTSYQPGLQILASSFAHIYHMGQKPQMGQSSLSDAVCWGMFLFSRKSGMFEVGLKTMIIHATFFRT